MTATVQPPVADHAARLARLEKLANRMDAAFRIPGTRFRIGLDSILGLVPGIGDALAVAPAGYIIHQAHRMGASRGTLARMIVNSGIDFAIGSVPLVGDIFDIGNKANRRNVALLRAHLAKRDGAATTVPPGPAPQRGLASPGN